MQGALLQRAQGAKESQPVKPDAQGGGPAGMKAKAGASCQPRAPGAVCIHQKPEEGGRSRRKQGAAATLISDPWRPELGGICVV